MHINSKIIVLLFVAIFPVSKLFAKDMTFRLGAGFKNNTSEDIPSVAIEYYAAKDLAYTGSLGIDTRQNNSALQISAGLRKIIYFENNLNFYVSGQGSLLNIETPAAGKKSGFDLLGAGGVEFYFAGLENLGFSLEAGLMLSTLGNTRIHSVADGPLRAGIVFYF